MTTARVCGPARPSSARVSSSVRNANTPSLSSPAIGGNHGALPVASSNVSYGVTLPSLPVTVFSSRIHVDHPHADAEVDGVPLIPLEPVDDDVVRALFPGEHRREQHPVVVDVGLVAEDRDVETRREREDLLEARHAGHAVADHDQLLHRAVLSTRTADCL